MLEIAMNQINVTNLDEAIKWYTEILGFSVSKEHYYPPRAVDLVQKGNIRLILYQVEKPAKTDYPNAVQSIIIFKTDDIQKMMTKLKEKGVEFVYPEAIEFPAGLFNAFRDPFGNVHEIVQFQ
ncbi:MAG: VOC family protein [Candidatus Hodarchaeales archaeon]|jgi:catechol 2,3-dioxygenase-like lactoylglutathione lyase family enzyme